MADSYDLIVLGGGTGGYSCALRAATLGLSVALVERGKLGGTCLHAGCIPTKALLQSAELAEHVRDAESLGVQASFEGIDVPGLQRYKQRVVDANHKGLQGALKARGVEVIPGAGRLRDPRTLEVDTEEGSRTLTAERGLVVATGSVPRSVPIEGAEIDGERVITSDHALGLDWLPQRPIVLGAGAVGVEFATIWHGLGAEQVTVVEMLDGLVPLEDADSQKALQRAFKKRGIQSLVSARATKVTRGDDGLSVTIESPNGEQTIEGDLLLVAIGRRPVTEDLGLEEAGAQLDKGFVTVDDRLRAGPSWEGGALYAVGDVLPPPFLGLAHASFQEGFLAAEHAAGVAHGPIDNAGIPRVTYSHPEVASVGLTEQQVQEQGIGYRTATFPFNHNARAMMLQEGGHVKVIAAEQSGELGRVLGVHVVGARATDLIAEAQLIYNWEALPTDVAHFIHPHPTLTEAIGEAHMQLAGTPLHGS